MACCTQKTTEKSEETFEFSRLTLRPRKAEMKVSYAEYLHEEVQTVAPWGAVIMGVFATVSLILALKNGEHKNLEAE